MIMIAVGLGSFAGFWYSWHREPRLLRNGPLLVTAVVSTILGVLSLVVDRDLLTAVLVWTVVVGGPGIAAALLLNGIIMLAREGRSLANRLSLAAGAVSVVVYVACFEYLLGSLSVWARVLGTALAYGVFLGTVTLLSFVALTLAHGVVRTRAAPVAIVVHGSGLVGGELTPLLRGRADRALRELDRERGRDNSPLLVASGGQGADETRPEADAIAEYLVGQGVDPSSVLRESTSTTTRENIANTVELLEAHGVTGPLCLVTSDYHVLRTGALARRMGVDAHVRGARTARYYVPSAFLRECVALILQNRIAFAVTAVLGALWFALAVVNGQLYDAFLIGYEAAPTSAGQGLHG